VAAESGCRNSHRGSLGREGDKAATTVTVCQSTGGGKIVTGEMGMAESAAGEDRYAEVLARQDGSPTLRALYRIALGEDYPEDVDPFGFVTRSDLVRIAELLGVGHGDLFADFGCGRGGPGLWVARRTGASVVGLDVVPAAIEQAEWRKTAFVAGERATFRVASFLASGLPDAHLDGVISVDALWMAADVAAAVAEVARVLKSDARLVMTTWEPIHLDHIALLAAAGLNVEVRDETPSWLPRQLTFYEGVLAAADLLARELGAAASHVLVEEARHTPALLPKAPRLLIMATKDS
jgi:SAM-dependent methyltransferase